MKNPHVGELLGHRSQIERSVSDHLGRKWYVKEIQDLAEMASHPSAVLSDGEFGVFAKIGSGLKADAQLRCEASGLSEMTELALTEHVARELWMGEILNLFFFKALTRELQCPASMPMAVIA